MVAKAPGEIVRLTWDGWGEVSEGDYMRTVTTGRTYRIVGVRVQQRGKWAGRHHLTCVVMEPDFEPEPDALVWMIRWYPRG